MQDLCSDLFIYLVNQTKDLNVSDVSQRLLEKVIKTYTNIINKYILKILKYTKGTSNEDNYVQEQ